ncbi:MAG: OprD family outer membrane porin, partial [Gammaproteobacteria bacterium]
FSTGSGANIKGFLQYTSQRSIGDERIGEFDTSLIAGKLELKDGDTTWRVALSTTDENSGIQKPYGNPANYLSVIVDDFDRAGEDAWLVGLSYDFKRVAIGDMSMFANVVSGNTPDSGVNASPDETEYDVTVDYRIKEGWANKLWLRVRAAYIDQDEDVGGDDFLDFRIIANYEFDML